MTEMNALRLQNKIPFTILGWLEEFDLDQTPATAKVFIQDQYGFYFAIIEASEPRCEATYRVVSIEEGKTL